jgi:hypothetical protein
MVSVLTVRKLRGYDLAGYPEGYVVATLYAGLVLGLVPAAAEAEGINSTSTFDIPCSIFII